MRNALVYSDSCYFNNAYFCGYVYLNVGKSYALDDNKVTYQGNTTIFCKQKINCPLFYISCECHNSTIRFYRVVFVMLSMRLLLIIKIRSYLVKYFGHIPSSAREESQLFCAGGSMKVCTILTNMYLVPLRIRNKGERDIFNITPL